MDRISDVERQRIAELLAEGAPFWRINQEINRSRHAVRRAILELQRPPRREPKRSPLRLSLAEREEISRGLAAGRPLRQIAASLGRAASTICREVHANGGRGRYRACDADRRAIFQATRPKASKLSKSTRLRRIVEDRLMLRWSPEQIAGWLKLAYPFEPEMWVSHETIYLSLFIQSKGALNKELTRYLRTRRGHRRRQGETPFHGQGQIRGMVNISERPPEANDRAVPGHWEGDLLLGKGYSAIATLVERKSRFVMLIRIPGRHTADVVADALSDAVVGLPTALRRSLTWDQGKEMAEHARFSVETGVPVYFCDPRSPWQRGTNENTNGLLRQYFPQRKDLAGFTQEELDHVADELNGRPRKTLDFLSPSVALDESLR